MENITEKDLRILNIVLMFSLMIVLLVFIFLMHLAGFFFLKHYFFG